MTGALARVALHYARHGLRVIPVNGKTPVTEHAYKDGTTDAAQIAAWFEKWPHANVGIVVGPESGVCVIDIDPRAGGDRELARLGELPPTWTVDTGGGGQHYYFRPDPRAVRKDLAPGVELKPYGGFVVAPPSIHPATVRPYRWRNEKQLAPLPEWVLALCAPTKPKQLAPAIPGTIPEGQRNATLTSLAGTMQRRGCTADTILEALRSENRARCEVPLADGELQRIVASVGRYPPAPAPTPASPTATIPPPATRPPGKSWAAAMDVHDYVNAVEPEGDFLVQRMIARGAVTSWNSPRGIGKTLAAHHVAVNLARQGSRVLLIDRDNPRREVKRRLRAWGLDGLESGRLKVIGREDAPPLTDAAKWGEFPVGEYDLVILDSFGSAAEGVGEQDSARPSLAIAALLDVVRGTKGPAALVLDNTTKSGTHGRGSGVIEDRLDIVFEVRDATGFQPSGTKDWWLELPASGRDAWADRAARRRKRDSYRLAFVPSKFRVGEEPDPFVFEVSCALEPWTCTDVTDALVGEGEHARIEAAATAVEKLNKAADALKAEVAAVHTKGTRVTKPAAEAFLMRLDLSQKAARALIAKRDGQDWRVDGTGKKLDPKVLRPLHPKSVADGDDGNTASTRMNGTGPESPSILVARDPCTPRESRPVGPASQAVETNGAFSLLPPKLLGALESFDLEQAGDIPFQSEDEDREVRAMLGLEPDEPGDGGVDA